MANCKLLEEIGTRASAVFVSTHHSIGIRALLFRTHSQRKWLPRLVIGNSSAFALTEREAGSDAAGIKCKRVKRGRLIFFLNGESVTSPTLQLRKFTSDGAHPCRDRTKRRSRPTGDA
jgi:alkylation response protein AidB-like acyl-CoA dehydrogenase